MSYDANFANVSLLLHMDGANNSTTFLDSSPTPEIVTAGGDAKVSTAQSKFGDASAYFDGTGDYLSIPATTDLEFGSGDGTVELWFRATSAPATAGGLIQRPNASGYANFSLNYRPSGALEAYCSLSNPATLPVILAPTGVITIGQWHHIAFVKSGLTYTLYVDGVSKASGTAASHPPTGLTTQTFIGALSASTFFVNGHIDDLRVTKGVARYTANFTPPTEAFPDRGPRVVGTITDASGNPASRTVRAYRRDTGALLGSAVPRDTTGDQWRRFVTLMLHADGANNSTTFLDSSRTPKTVTAAGGAKISTAQSKFGGASALFNGSTDYLTVPHSTEFSIQAMDFTLEAWVYRSASGVSHYLLSKRPNSATANGWEWRINANDTLQFFYTGGSSLTSSATIASGQWVHVATTRSGTTVRHFINGVAAGSGTFANGTENTADTLKIAAANDLSTKFNGYIDDLRITAGVARYTDNFTPHTVAHPDYDNSASLNEYVIETGTFTGDVQIVALAADNTRNSQVLDWVTPA